MFRPHWPPVWPWPLVVRSETFWEKNDVCECSHAGLASAAPSLGDWFQNKKGAQAENEGLILGTSTLITSLNRRLQCVFECVWIVRVIGKVGYGWRNKHKLVYFTDIWLFFDAIFWNIVNRKYGIDYLQKWLKSLQWPLLKSENLDILMKL